MMNHRDLHSYRDSLEIETKNFAIYNDVALNHRLLTYHIGVPQQLQQLRHIGFQEIQAIGEQGELLDDRIAYLEGSMTHFTAKKP